MKKGKIVFNNSVVIKDKGEFAQLPEFVGPKNYFLPLIDFGTVFVGGYYADFANINSFE